MKKTGGVSEFSQSGIIVNDVLILFILKVLFLITLGEGVVKWQKFTQHSLIENSVFALLNFPGSSELGIE